jgi:hypothetical protein
MATPDDTSEPMRSRRNQPKASAAPRSEAPSAAFASATPPLTLEEVIENERTMLLQIRAMLHCLYEVLLYADDNDSVLHAEVARTAARLINDSCARLDSVNVGPLIKAIRSGGGRELPGFIHAEAHQVRELRPVYHA